MEAKGRIEHTVKNVIWIYISSAVGSIFPFIIRTLIIKYLGMEYLGLNSIYASILQVLNMSELGIGQAIGISMYRPVAEGNTNEVNKLISLFSRFYFILGIWVCLIGVILIPFLPQIMNGEYPEDVSVLLGYLIYLGQAVLGYFVYPYCNTVFMANQSIEKVYKYQSLIWVFVYSIQIAVLCKYRNYYTYLLLLPIGTILCGFANHLGMKKYYPQYHVLKIRKEKLKKEFWNLFLKRASAMTLSKLRIVSRSSVDTIIISAVIGVITAAKYQNYILTMTVPLMLISSIITGILPSLGNRVAIETKESNLAIIRLITFILHWIGTVFASILMCFYQPFIKLWSGNEGLLSEKAVFLFVGYFYIRVISEISILIRNSSGVWWEGKWIAIVESVVNIGLNIIFVNIWGVEGIIFATIISMLVINIPFETYSVFMNYFHIKPWNDLKNYFIQACIALITVLITYYSILLGRNIGISPIFVDILLCVLISNFVLIIFHFKNEKFQKTLEIIFQVLGKKKG